MGRFAVQGNGGSDESTTAPITYPVLSRPGNRVLHVGCHPKHDGSVGLVDDPAQFRIIMNRVFPVRAPERAPRGVSMVEQRGRIDPQPATLPLWNCRLEARSVRMVSKRLSPRGACRWSTASGTSTLAPSTR